MIYNIKFHELASYVERSKAGEFDIFSMTPKQGGYELSVRETPGVKMVNQNLGVRPHLSNAAATPAPVPTGSPSPESTLTPPAAPPRALLVECEVCGMDKKPDENCRTCEAFKNIHESLKRNNRNYAVEKRFTK